MRLIDFDKIEWYGCTSEDDCPYPYLECKDCDRGKCSKTQVESLPIIHAVPIEVLQEIRDEIDGLTFYWCEVHPRSVIDECLSIIDNHIEQYKGEET